MIGSVICVALVGLVVQQEPATPSSVLARFETQIGDLLKKPQPDLFAWHLRSIRSIARTLYSTLSLEQANYLRRPYADHSKEFVDYLTTISKGFDGDCANPDCYLKDGNRTLILARASEIEGSLQYFMLDLPRGWDPKQAYPLSIGLHGTGPDNALAYPSFALGPRDKAPTPDPKRVPMINLTPWGRGNRGWRGDAERDLFEAIASVKTFATLDPDRWYITGHSAGGDGSWAIVQHTPDLWAAAGMQSGSMLSGRPEWGLIENMKYVPFHILIGEKDPLPNRIPDSKEAYRLLKEMGDETELVIAPGAGHYPLPADALEEQDRWMKKFVRKRPTKFSFTIDQAQHNGVWGIKVPMNAWERQLVKEPWPHFDVTIENYEITFQRQVVKINTKNIEAMTVDLGVEGLKLSGIVTLIVNGKEVYKGEIPAKPVSVDLRSTVKGLY